MTIFTQAAEKRQRKASVEPRYKIETSTFGSTLKFDTWTGATWVMFTMQNGLPEWRRVDEGAPAKEWVPQRIAG